MYFLDILSLPLPLWLERSTGHEESQILHSSPASLSLSITSKL